MRSTFLLMLFVWTTLADPRPASRPVFLYASLSGRPTYDVDAAGGNPFATALIQSLSRKSASFEEFKSDLVALTERASRGAQQAEIVDGRHLSGWQFLPRSRNEQSIALVIVFSAYAGSGLGASLPGAERDAHRIAKALSETGFVVTRLIDPDARALERSLGDFARRTTDADVAVIYTTGHGIEADGVARVLLPYPRANGSKTLPVSELAKAARAHRANLIFYAACRNKEAEPR